MSDQFNPNESSRPVNGNGAGYAQKMHELAQLLEMVLAKYAGGFANPVPVRIINERDQEVEVAISPIQAIVNLTAAMNDLEVQLADMRAEDESNEFDEDEDDAPKRKRRR